MRHDCFSISHRIFCFPAGAGPAILRVNQQPDVQLERCCSLRLSLATPTVRRTGVPSLRTPSPLGPLRSGSHGHLDGIAAALPEVRIATRPRLRYCVRSGWEWWRRKRDVNRERPLDV